MKKIMLLALIAICFNANAQIIDCFSTPDGIEIPDTQGWSYKEYRVPVGLQVDSIYADFDRPGYPESEFDIIVGFTQDTFEYDNSQAIGSFSYQDTNTSLYDSWINLETAGFTGKGVLRVYAPVNAGVIWNELCIAVSYNGESLGDAAYLEGLVAHYPFNGNAHDVSGNELHGEVNGANLTTDRFGNPNSAYYYDGLQDYIVVENDTLLNFEEENVFSLDYWILPETIDVQKINWLLFKRTGSGTTQDGWEAKIQQFSGVSNLRVSDGNQNTCDGDPSIAGIQLNEWIHITQVFDNGTMYIYENGGLIFENTTCGGIVGDNTSDLFIGASGIGNGQFTKNFNGKIDDLCIFSSALQACDVQQIHASSAVDPCAVNAAQGDFNCDGAVDSIDLLSFLARFGTIVE